MFFSVTGTPAKVAFVQKWGVLLVSLSRSKPALMLFWAANAAGPVMGDFREFCTVETD
jgi:hypothetical protein